MTHFSVSDHLDGGNFAKLFVGSVPRTATEEDVSYIAQWFFFIFCTLNDIDFSLVWFINDYLLSCYDYLMPDSPFVWGTWERDWGCPHQR